MRRKDGREYKPEAPYSSDRETARNVESQVDRSELEDDGMNALDETFLGLGHVAPPAFSVERWRNAGIIMEGKKQDIRWIFFATTLTLSPSYGNLSFLPSTSAPVVITL